MRFTPGVVLAIIIAVALIIIILLIASIYHWGCVTSPANPQKILSFPATLGEGTHYIDSPLNWSGSGPAINISNVNNAKLFFINSGKITLSGVGPAYNLDDPNQAYGSLLSGVFVNNANNIEILTVSILSNQNANNNSFGVIVFNSKDVTVDGGNFDNLAEGVSVVSSSGVVVNNNTFVDIYGTVDSNPDNVPNTGAAVSIENSSVVDVSNNDTYTSGKYSDPSLSSTFVYVGTQGVTNLHSSNNKATNVGRGIRVRSGSQFVFNDNKLSASALDTDYLQDGAAISASKNTKGFSVRGGYYKSTGRNVVPILLGGSSSSIKDAQIEAVGTFFCLLRVGTGSIVEDNILLGTDVLDGVDGIIAGGDEEQTDTATSIRGNTVNVNSRIGESDGYVPAGIRAQNIVGGIVDGNTVIGGPDSLTAIGILLEQGTSNLTVSNNTIGTYGMGIEDDFGSNNKILSNNITGNGILIAADCDIISKNNISGGCVSIELTCDSSNNLVSKNQVTCARPIVDDGHYNRLVDNLDGNCGCEGNQNDSQPSKFKTYPKNKPNNKSNNITKKDTNKQTSRDKNVAIISAN